MTVPVRLVYSFAPVDNTFREHLSAHLQPLVQNGLLTEWYEQLTPPGSDVAQERQKAWQSADILLLLLSADYFASDVFDSQEMQRTLDRHKSGQVHIVPVLVRPCDWQGTLLAGLQCLPRNSKPVSMWENRDDALLSIVQDLRRIITGQEPVAAPAVVLTSEQRITRQRLIKRVRTTWIDGLLKESLQHAVWVDLHLQKQPDVLENPWSLMVQELDREPRPLPPGTSILQVLDEADEELLILGDPGSGKTTLLLYLARIVFNLSSWARQRLPLAQWLLEELVLQLELGARIKREG